MQPIDDKLVRKIHELVADGVNSVSEMERHLNSHVKNELFQGRTLPDSTSRRFYPTRSDIRNHMYQATIQHRHSKVDQENLQVKVEEWQKENPEDNFLFKPLLAEGEGMQGMANTTAADANEADDLDDDVVSLSKEGNNFIMFVHQTKWQRELLEKYGGEICMLDATYKTCRYALPLFFLCVKTNVDYCVVGSFFIQHEDAISILEALKVLKAWNPSWNPPYFMVLQAHLV